VRGALRTLAAHRLSGALDVAKLLLMSAHALAGRLFEHGGSKAWLYGSAMHGDVPPDGAGSAIAAAHLNLMGHAVGWPSPAGGADRLAGALTGYLEALGGRIRTSAPVTRIHVAHGRVAAVEVAGEERVAARTVVADVMPAALLRLAGEAVGARYAGHLRAYRAGPATLKVDWALSRPIPWAAPEARAAGTVHVGGADDATAERPFLLLGQQSLADPGRAPAGRHTAWAYTHGPPGAGWPRDADRHVERMEAQVERFAPGFRDSILARHVLGPAGLEQRDANLLAGDVGGGSYALDQVVFRPVPSLSPYRTPVRGLYLGSAAAFPGGAVHGVPGHAAARIALRERRLRRA
jgi:phytoene dehydrogenase-like protein